MSKKVILRSVADETYSGYLPQAEFVKVDDGVGSISLLDPAGRLMHLPLAEVRWIAWVRDFNGGDSKNPERLERRAFLARPKAEGLWVRVHLRGATPIEGLAAADVSLFDGMLRDRGLFMTPPDPRSNTQRLFVPRLTITGLELLAVVTTPSRQASGKRAAESHRPAGQTSLFPPA